MKRTDKAIIGLAALALGFIGGKALQLQIDRTAIEAADVEVKRGIAISQRASAYIDALQTELAEAKRWIPVATTNGGRDPGDDGDWWIRSSYPQAGGQQTFEWTNSTASPGREWVRMTRKAVAK